MMQPHASHHPLVITVLVVCISFACWLVYGVVRLVLAILSRLQANLHEYLSRRNTPWQ